jgi:hypothetical protein
MLYYHRAGHLRYAQPWIPVYLSRAKDIAKRFPGVPSENQIINSSFHKIRWRVTGLFTTLDAFNAKVEMIYSPASTN